MDSEVSRALDALNHIDAACARDVWVRAGMAAKSAGIAFADFNNWSASAPNYVNENDCRSTWKSFDESGAVTPATLFGMAYEQGWQDPSKRTNSSYPNPSTTQTKQAPPKPVKQAENSKAADVWARCEQATNEHPYITDKGAAGVPLDDLRVLPAGDPLRIAGEPMAGALVVPIRRVDRSISSLQFIATPDVAKRLKAKGKPGKLNMPGAPLEGWHTVGEVVPGGVIFICEGIGSAWACWQATGDAAVACFGWGRVRTVAAALLARDASAKLTLCPDAGKESDADKIAREVGVLVAAMPEGWQSNSDVADLKAREGGDALEALLLAARAPAPPEALLKPVCVFDVLTNPAPPPEFIWDGYLPRGVVTLMGAHGGTGKSTVALMLGVCVAASRPLFEVYTVGCSALFVSMEDSARIVRHRLAWVCRTWNIDPRSIDGKLHIVDGTENPELFTADSRNAGEVTATYDELCKLVQSTGAGLVVVDNASDAFGGDEINRRQVRAFMRALAQVARLTNCAVLLLAHVDKNTSRARKAEGSEAYSGSTAWHNSARSRLFMTRNEDGTLSLEHQKSNFGKMREPLTLEWPGAGLPQLVANGGDGSYILGMTSRADDDRAIAVLKLIDEYEGREEYCSPMPTARNNVFAMLKADPAFRALKLNSDDTKRILTQCQRAKQIEPFEYRSHDRKYRQRWTLTTDGRMFAGILAPTAPTCAHISITDDGALGANGGAPTAPTYAGGVGDSARTNEGAELEPLTVAEPSTTATTHRYVGAAPKQESSHG